MEKIDACSGKGFIAVANEKQESYISYDNGLVWSSIPYLTFLGLKHCLNIESLDSEARTLCEFLKTA